MAAALGRDAKHPAFAFMPDADAKRSAASAAVHAASERWAMPAYRRLLGRTLGA